LRSATLAVLLLLGVGLFAIGCSSGDEGHPDPTMSKNDAPPAKAGGSATAAGAPVPGLAPGAGGVSREPGTKVK